MPVLDGCCVDRKEVRSERKFWKLAGLSTAGASAALAVVDSYQRGQLVVGPSVSWRFVDTGAGTISGAPRKALRAATSRFNNISCSFSRNSSHIPSPQLTAISNNQIQLKQLTQTTQFIQIHQNDWRKVRRQGQRCQINCSIVSLH